MKIKFSLTKLEIARSNPLQFAKSLKSKTRGNTFFNYSRWMAWQNAVHEWNKNNSQSGAINYLTNALSNFKIVQKKPKEGGYYIDKLQAYISSHITNGYYSLESKHRVLIDINPIVSISGQIPVINMNNNSGYSIILLAKEDLPLDSELKFPLLQNYFASKVYGVEVSEVEVGYYNFERERFITKSFSKIKITKALKEVSNIADVILKNY